MACCKEQSHWLASILMGSFTRRLRDFVLTIGRPRFIILPVATLVTPKTRGIWDNVGDDINAKIAIRTEHF
ncbi:hypothetical protein HMPREF9103_00984 [Lentilactobacillus parafarraginis F0439]|uniref:Uncharacterized protein n=1 Tax=Lentilactobacillus parafarraginis F0439 TaxID=797515 RepID=G9ZMN4_9LACO|nr:hypothetical protein HMPREF9103_00984 [Lentilactobacillus parafarraginis F0439]